MNRNETILGMKTGPLSREPEGFAKIYDTYVAHIYRFIYFKVGREQDAQDLTSEVFLKLWATIRGRTDEIKNIRAFVYKIARNIVIDFYRKNKNEIHIEEVSEIDFASEAPITLLSKTDDLQSTLSALRQLKEEYKEIIIMRYLDELSYSEISEATGKSLIGVRVLAHRALSALKKVLGA